jgi:GntR family transcriptional regulator/MocR family aminotransferase
VSTEPKYRQIVRELMRQIDTGELAANAKLPSTVELCVQFNCSQTAVNTAVLLLMNENYIMGRPGVGRFVMPLG